MVFLGRMVPGTRILKPLPWVPRKHKHPTNHGFWSKALGSGCRILRLCRILSLWDTCSTTPEDTLGRPANEAARLYLLGYLAAQGTSYLLSNCNYQPTVIGTTLLKELILGS